MTAIPITLRSLTREPTLHFFLIAGLLFAIYAFNESRSGEVLEVEQSEIDARIFLQELSSGQALTEEQREFITATYIEEQILVREALAMNLDADARIHDILAQKMRHVLSGDIIQPTITELSQYYAENTARYESMATVSTDEMVLNTNEPLSDAVTDLLQQGANPEAVIALTAGNVSPLPNVNHLDLSNIFSPEYADRVFAASMGEWVGPYPSNRGQHWLKVREINPARTPALDEITDRVRIDWISEKEESRLQEEIDKLWDRYTILINATAE